MVAGVIFKDPKVAGKVVELLVANGVFPINTWSDSIKLGPPLTISEEAIHEAIDVFEDSIKSIK